MLENGLKRAIGDFTVAAYVEIEAFCIYNLVAQMEQGVLDPAPIWSDAKTFQSQSFHRKVHGIIGGYPCQPFSLAGQRKGENDPRHLWPYLRYHIQQARPKWCFFENVKDHLSLGFDTVYKELEALGYAVEAGIFSAKECGAPHERQRLFILAVENAVCIGNRRRNDVSIIRGCQVQTSGSSTMAYAECDTQGGLPQRTREEYPGFTMRGKNVPDTDSVNERKILPEAGKPIIRRKSLLDGDKWPAPRGVEQYHWEEPRTIESGLGCTIDGYNFREDLLRMLGNGVVEQTAELAFRHLINKHGLNYLLPK